MTGICRSYGAKFIFGLWFYKYVPPDGAGEPVLPVRWFAGKLFKATAGNTRKVFWKFVRVFRVVRINLPRRAWEKCGDKENNKFTLTSQSLPFVLFSS